MKRGDRGVTLIEVLIAVSLLGLLSVGMLMAIRVALNALDKTSARLIDNRRITGVERILQQEIAGLMPVTALCMASPENRVPAPFFEGEPQGMRLVSTFSLGEAWRGRPQVLEFLVIPREDGQGVRLVVNEIPYTGQLGVGQLCLGPVLDPVLGVAVTRFQPIEARATSFVLADRLASCRFAYLAPAPPGTPPPALPRWTPKWTWPLWPLAVRIELEPLDADPARLRVLTVTAPVQVTRRPESNNYVDY